jgi:hypothetical protein
MMSQAYSKGTARRVYTMPVAQDSMTVHLPWSVPKNVPWSISRNVLEYVPDIYSDRNAVFFMSQAWRAS